MGGADSVARWASTRARFSPACFRPVNNSAIRCPCRVDTIPEVNSLRPFARARGFFFLLRRARTSARQRQNLHAGVIVIKDFPLRRLAEQLFKSGPNHFGGFVDNFPLGRGGQWNP